MRMSNAILNKQDEGRKKKKKEMPERHLINESCVYVEKEKPCVPPPPSCTGTHKLFVCKWFMYQLCSCRQRDLRAGDSEDSSREARLGVWGVSVCRCLGRSHVPGGEVASQSPEFCLLCPSSVLC